MEALSRPPCPHAEEPGDFLEEVVPNGRLNESVAPLQAGSGLCGGLEAREPLAGWRTELNAPELKAEFRGGAWEGCAGAVSLLVSFSCLRHVQPTKVRGRAGRPPCGMKTKGLSRRS